MESICVKGSLINMGGISILNKINILTMQIVDILAMWVCVVPSVLMATSTFSTLKLTNSTISFIPEGQDLRRIRYSTLDHAG